MKPVISRCPECGTLLKPQQQGPCCGDSECAVLKARIEARLELEQDSLASELDAARELAIKTTQGLSKEQLLNLVLPASEVTPLAELEETRLVALREHLDVICEQANREDFDAQADLPNANVADSEPTEIGRKMIASACATCQGQCCAQGGDHGYFRAADIQRLGRELSLSAKQLKQALMSHLGGLKQQGACIFLAEEGCALPKTHRSQTCNQFLCKPITEFLPDYPAQGAPILLLARNGQRKFVRRFLFQPDEHQDF